MLLPFDDALATLIAAAQAAPPRAVEEVPIAAAAGRILAEDLRAPEDLPRFDHATMDGYALAAADFAADRAMPVPFAVRAGGDLPPPLPSASAARIFTGAPLPEGADAVVPQERAEAAEGLVTLRGEAPAAGTFVRRRGAELARGAVALAAGTRLTAGTLPLLATLDRATVPVRRALRVGVLPTGDELRAPGSAPRPGSIPEANGAAIAALAASVGAAATVLPVVTDDRAATDAALAEALARFDVVVPIGGVSVGDHDHVPGALAAAGVATRFYKVAIKPGKPLLFGEAPGGARVLALPGNPASAFVTFVLFGLPLLRALSGDRAPWPPTRIVTARAPIGHALGRLEFLRGAVDGAGFATVAADQASGALRSLAAANALLALPGDVATIPAGAPLTAYLLPS